MTYLAASLRLTPAMTFSWRRAQHVVEHNILNYRRNWFYLVSGFFEPFFYLLGIGVGLSSLVGPLRIDGHLVSYATFVAPGLLASAAMNGAMFDATYNFFFKLKVEKTYEAMLATPLGVLDVACGELGWTLIRGMIYSAGFLLVMTGFGYCQSPWAILCLPAAALISLAFGACGLAATSFMRAWQDLGSVSLAMLPMFLFSGTFYALNVYPGWLQAIVRVTPLYQGVVLLRDLDVGAFNTMMLLHIAYLVALTFGGLIVVSYRLKKVLTP
jgi:lipooligosaccharide transport system permease protein